MSGQHAASLTPSLSRLRASRAERRLAKLAVLLLLVLTVVAYATRAIQGPVAPSFIAVAATMWGLAAMLTTLLFFTQLIVTRSLSSGILGLAYGITGLLTIPYLINFTGVFGLGSASVGSQQISVALWLTWHATFPLFVMGCSWIDPGFKREVAAGRWVRVLLVAFCITMAVAAVSLGAAMWLGADRLPVFVSKGHFQPVFRQIYIPVVVFLNLLAAITVFVRRRDWSSLHLWLVIVLVTSSADGIINCFVGARYTVPWYIGQFETLAAASIVLFVLLVESIRVYSRMAEAAAIDSLTGLRNRRALDEHMRYLLAIGRRQGQALSVLMVNVDCFRQFNDAYGHLAGDDCLRVVAGVAAASSRRASDLVARYGGEEFVIVFLGSSEAGAMTVAERIRSGVQGLNIAHAASGAARCVTVSIGIAHFPDASLIPDASEVFNLADRALYSAKHGGRNRVFLDVAKSPAGRRRTYAA